MESSTSSSSSYSGILEKTRLSQPSFQRFAVVALFNKLRSAAPSLGLGSVAGRDAVSLCLASPSAAVVDQAVRELCRLVRDGLLEPTAALIELQSALDGCDSRFVPLFVKGIGFLARLAFRLDTSWGRRFDPVETHPFVKVLSSREEARAELIEQVLLFIVHNKSPGLGPALEFLRPFLLFAIIRIPSSADVASFVLDLTSSIASLACSIPSEALDILKLSTVCLNYFACSTDGEFRYLCAFAECLANTFVVVLKQVVDDKKLIADAHSCTLHFLESIFSLFTGATIPRGGIGFVMGLAKHLFVAQRELKLFYPAQIYSITVCASIILSQAEFEHEQLSVMKLLVFLSDWKTEHEHDLRTDLWHPSEELFYIFPVINLMSSPCKSVKSVAAQLLSRVNNMLIDLLVGARRKQIPASYTPCISRLDSILVNLLNRLWFQDQSSTHLSFFIGQPSSNIHGNDERCSDAKNWTCKLREYLSSVGRQKVTTLSQSTTDALPGLSVLLSAVASMLTLHPEVGMSAIDSLAAIGVLDPKLSTPLVLLVLFYSNVLCKNQHGSSEKLFKLLAMLPSLASSIMIPLVLQTIMPMLQKDVNPLLYAAGVRLLCKMWMTTDLAFGNLQGILDPAMFLQFMVKREICVSFAASVRDVCRHNPDRGVDLILSVSSCIESRDSVVQTLGLESLAHLCEADVVDFYTAWDVISEHLLDHSVDPIVAHDLCTLLRWGAMDAESYFEVSKTILQTLWDLGSFKRHKTEPSWIKVRVAAFKSLCEYQVLHIQEAIPEFKRKNLECLLSEDNMEVLGAMEEFQIKIINIEHTTRRRVLKQKRPMVHKVEKLLDVLPRVIFSSVKPSCTELPGAALLSLAFTPKDLTDQGISRDLLKLHAPYENAMMEIAESLHCSRDLYLGLLILQSWKPFFHRWMRAAVISDSKGSPSDRISSAANDILKRLFKVGKESIPRIVVNISLAIGALCTVLPTSAHFVIADASDFLLKWLFEYEHEHLQWSAAISLGVVSTCFDISDVNHKLELINGLLEVLCKGKSHLIKGACGIGLGFACQNLLKGIDDSIFEDRTVKAMENTLLQDTIYTLCQTISLLCPSTSESLVSFTKSFLPSGCTKFSLENCDITEDDAWGVAGLVIGLGSSVITLYRFGVYDALVKLNDLLVSWIPADLSSHKFSKLYGSAEISLFMGCCLVFPAVVSFCQRNELIEVDCNALLNRYTSLISYILDMKKPGGLYQNLLVASCIGCGSFVSCIMNLGVQSLDSNDIMSLLEIMRNAYTQSYPPSVCLGGMLGIVNAFGADADVLHMNAQQKTSQESTLTSQPIFSNPTCEALSMSVIQEMFLIAKDSKDQLTRKNAAWALSFLRERWWSNELSDINLQTSSMSLTQNISEESLVWKLCLWLRDHQYSEIGQIPLTTISTVLRCLSRAPRLPSFEWGAIIRRCMKYESQLPDVNMKFNPVLLREECVSFSLGHAHHISSLLHFIDELCDLVRFRRLELNLQFLVLQHFQNLLKLFSSHRLEKLFCDFIEYFSSPSSSYVTYVEEQKSALRVSFWKGIYLCLNGDSKDPIVTLNLERLMECLFSFLPDLTSESVLAKQAASEEWSVATKCFAEAQEAWLSGVLQVPILGVYHGANKSAIANKISMKAKLVGIGRFPASDLAELKVQLFNVETEDLWWGVLIEVAATLSVAGNVVKRQWLLGALEISCVTEYPSTALRFVGLLSGSCCVYMPLLIVDPTTVLSDLPVTLPSLLSDGSWRTIAGAVAEKLLASTERLCAWRRRLAQDDGAPTQNLISESQTDTIFLFRVMHRTCILLKDYLPLDKRLKLISLEMPENW